MLITTPLCNHHLKHPLLQKGHSYIIQGVNFLKETMGLTTRHHSPRRCRTDTPLIPQACVPAQGPRRQFTLEGGLLGTELYLVPPSTFSVIQNRLIHWSNFLLKWRLTPKKTLQPLTQTEISVQQMMHTIPSPPRSPCTRGLHCFIVAMKTTHFKRHTVRHLRTPKLLIGRWFAPWLEL